ncbi:peptidylprolyl isomerase [Simiduia curdlanivorans]|uniref:Peptidyl-prolyl cis-trans isomerase n=1 Tax=Simiduia curdlanivorans TaxID=1492769 RepID=A0ABV8V8F3_9GAMM|nr:peptidylprolyl isomerase [Simiduia curdlanivorans]MDN3639467.1 peptidylprolyl isomerase [Simiduia curdlanivorans]
MNLKKILFALALLSLTLPALAANPKVQLDTDLGVIVLEVFSDKAPITAANFLTYVDQGFYNGTIFHRVIPGFVVQGGGMTFDFVSKATRDPIANESNNGLLNNYGTLSMARTSHPDSATSQFFINVNVRGNPHLDPQKSMPGYAVFAKVIKGIDVVDAITRQPRGQFRAYPEAPNNPIRIIKASRL